MELGLSCPIPTRAQQRSFLPFDTGIEVYAPTA